MNPTPKSLFPPHYFSSSETTNGAGPLQVPPLAQIRSNSILQIVRFKSNLVAGERAGNCCIDRTAFGIYHSDQTWLGEHVTSRDRLAVSSRSHVEQRDVTGIVDRRIHDVAIGVGRCGADGDAAAHRGTGNILAETGGDHQIATIIV